MTASGVPLYAVVGHPNEGKSSVVSTLAEDESVRISAVPGETRACRTFPVEVDGEEMLRFVDTPGFQHPREVLAWFEAYDGAPDGIVKAFVGQHEREARLSADVELLRPLADHAGILYVVDGARPVREDDRAEMEILRLTGLPRMAVVNAKHEDTRYFEAWKSAFSRTFNLVWTFNAHRASFKERVALLDALKSLDQQQAGRLDRVVEALRLDWDHRIRQVSVELERLIEDAVTHVESLPVEGRDPTPKEREQLEERYLASLRRIEARAHDVIKRRFRHEQLPLEGAGEGLVVEDLFSRTVWKVLGLTRSQLTWSSTVTGALLGAGADAAAAGLTFGVFTVGGAVAGALGGWLGGPRLGRLRWPLPGPFGRRTLGREIQQLGPCRDPQLVYVLLDRALLLTGRVMNWAHARRDHEAFLEGLKSGEGFVSEWSAKDREVVLRFYAALRGGKDLRREEIALAFRDLLTEKLHALAE